MIFQKKDLQGVVDICSTAISKSDSIPVLKNICFKKDGVYANNLFVGVYMELDTQGLDCLVPFDKFSVFVKGAKKDEIEIEIEDENLKLKSGRSKSTIAIEPSEDFPDFDSLLGEGRLSLPVNDSLLEGFITCLTFKAKKSVRTELTGIHVKDIVMFASDGNRIAEFTHNIDMGGNGLNISEYIIKTLMKVGSINTVEFDEQVVLFKTEGITVFGNLLDGDYPDMSMYFPKVKKFIKLPTTELKAGLKKVGDFAGEEFQEASCTVEFGDNTQIKYESSIAQISEVFNFGNKLPAGIYTLNPYHFAVLLDKCEQFAFISDPEDMLYAKSGAFRCVLNVKKES